MNLVGKGLSKAQLDIYKAYNIYSEQNLIEVLREVYRESKRFDKLDIQKKNLIEQFYIDFGLNKKNITAFNPFYSHRITMDLFNINKHNKDIDYGDILVLLDNLDLNILDLLFMDNNVLSNLIHKIREDLALITTPLSRFSIIIILKYYNEMSYEEMGKLFNVTRSFIGEKVINFKQRLNRRINNIKAKDLESSIANEVNELQKSPISNLGISNKLHNVLRRNNIHTVIDLYNRYHGYTDEEIKEEALKLKGLGFKLVSELIEAVNSITEDQFYEIEKLKVIEGIKRTKKVDSEKIFEYRIKFKTLEEVLKNATEDQIKQLILDIKSNKEE